VLTPYGRAGRCGFGGRGVTARAEVEAHVTPKLLDMEIDRRHRSFMSAILREDVGHVRSHTTRTLLLIHDLWVPKYVN
jgi:hypothetical protein